MPASADKPDQFDPFGITASMNEWHGLLRAARELKDIDEEQVDTIQEAYISGPSQSTPDAVAKVGNLATLMRSLQLDPEAIRKREPEFMEELEAACLHCTQRNRCTGELRAGTAAGTYEEFCPNAPSLGQLLRA